MLLVGGIGSGKSAALQAIRSALRDSGRTVLSRPPYPTENAAAVIALNGPDQVNQQRARDLMKTILGNLEKSASTSEAQTETLFR